MKEFHTMLARRRGEGGGGGGGSRGSNESPLRFNDGGLKTLCFPYIVIHTG